MKASERRLIAILALLGPSISEWFSNAGAWFQQLLSG